LTTVWPPLRTRRFSQRPAPAPNPATGRLEFGLFALVLGVGLLALRTDFGYDGQMMYKITESLALRHSLQVQDRSWHAN
jgi:hypothetical protein